VVLHNRCYNCMYLHNNDVLIMQCEQKISYIWSITPTTSITQQNRFTYLDNKHCLALSSTATLIESSCCKCISTDSHDEWGGREIPFSIICRIDSTVRFSALLNAKFTSSSHCRLSFHFEQITENDIIAFS